MRAQNRRRRLEADARREEYRDRGFALTVAHSNARAKVREKARPSPYPTRARVLCLWRLMWRQNRARVCVQAQRERMLEQRKSLGESQT